MTYIDGCTDTLMADCIEVGPAPANLGLAWQDRVAPAASAATDLS